MGIRGLATTDQAGLFDDVPDMIAVTRHLLLDHALPAMYLSLAAARLRADCPSGKAPNTRVRRG